MTPPEFSFLFRVANRTLVRQHFALQRLVFLNPVRLHYSFPQAGQIQPRVERGVRIIAGDILHDHQSQQTCVGSSTQII